MGRDAGADSAVRVGGDLLLRDVVVAGVAREFLDPQVLMSSYAMTARCIKRCHYLV